MQSVSRLGVISTPLPIATQAGLEVLQQDGTAIDAALAAAAVLCVAYPHMTGLGGDAFWLIAEPDGHALTISGVGHCATAAVPASGVSLPMHGAGSALTTAGAVASWADAFAYSRDRWRTRMRWADLLRPAWTYADQGFDVSPAQAFWHQEHRTLLRAQPGFARAYEPAGHVPQAGERLCSSDLAASLQLLIDEGADSFYRGRLADRLHAGFREAGVAITRDDLRATHCERGEPLRLRYRDGVALNLAPPSQGVTSLQILGQLGNFDLQRFAAGSVDHLHLMVEAVKRAFADRNRWLADPRSQHIPVATLLSDEYLHDLAASIDPAQARHWPDTTRSGDTVWLGAVDRQGRCVSLIQSIFTAFGSGLVIGDTGILWHNRGSAFRTTADHPNCIAAGKRPAHTLNPAIYLQHGRPRFIYGTQGADGQPQTQTALITRAIDYAQPIETAICAPRFLLGRSFFDNRENLKIEADAGQAVIDGLRARGHDVEVVDACNPMMGQAGLIAIEANGTADGVHDPRGQGIALGV